VKYPPTRSEDVRETLFGVEVRDPYRWLEDEKSPEVRTWMAEQDRFARAHLHALPQRERLMERLRALYYIDAIGAPQRRGKRYFYARRHADREKGVMYYREDGEERVLIDPNTMSPDGTLSIGLWSPSWCGRWCAYTKKANNSDEATLYVREVATGRDSEIDVIPGAKYASPSWTPSGDGFYYTWLPTDPSIPVADRPGFAEVRFHRLGDDPARDEIVHARTGNPMQFVGGAVSRDGRWLFFAVQHGWNSTDYWFRDLHAGDREWRPLIVGVDAQYGVTAWRNIFYVHTNEGAPRWRLFAVDPSNVERSAWREIVPESDAVLSSWDIVGEHLALTYLRNASSELELRTLEGVRVRKVALPGIGTSSGLIGNPDDDEAYFDFTSFTVPGEIYKTSINSGSVEKWTEVKVPIDPSPFTVEQVWYPSKDGTRISMFLVHRHDLKRDGSTPFLLGAYGGFNVSMTPSFSGERYPWLEAGGGYAIPNLRGGGEYGEAWHRAGMLENKQNVFDDFIAAAEFLINTGYTRPERLAIRGGSNGGLLMGAAVTQRPDLFRAVLCAVPLLDMLRYHLFGSGKTWIPEYGSAEDEAKFRILNAYSPYHRVASGTRYPALIMMSADADDRVDPMHARKMTAALQAANAGEHPILLRIEQNAGHGGADLVKAAVESSADSFAFLMREVGL
jgi:prolyl oligopeptidase